jgi:isoleucyl-tRNA synthetase
VPCPVDSSGLFTAEVPDFVGQYVKDADKGIKEKLKQMGRLVRATTFVHQYPFCWRSETPLLYRAVPSWFVAVEKIKDRVLANSQKTTWYLCDDRMTIE